LDPILRTLPNVLSGLRLGLGLVFPLLPPGWRVWAVAAAAATDALDGPLARRFSPGSTTGRLLDPLADKVFALAVLGTCLADGALTPGWAAAVLARDLIVLAGVAVVAARRRWAEYRRMTPTPLGKAATAAQLALLLVLTATGGARPWLLWATAALSSAAAADYARRFFAANDPPAPGR
jgi:CDP-diacylglycerol--glycerol-3-phosphate 3-phosphatidyltransferase/cardiolipin synthase